MNTKASVAYGWGVLILAGGGAYYFAKKSINSDRADRAAAIERERQHVQRLRALEYSNRSASPTAATSTLTKPASKPESPRDPSMPASQDPAPVAHAQEEPVPGSKYAASEPYRSRRGDRFS